MFPKCECTSITCHPEYPCVEIPIVTVDLDLPIVASYKIRVCTVCSLEYKQDGFNMEVDVNVS